MDKYDVAIAKAAAADLGGFKEITIEALKEKQERDNPKPLTLDELRERDGKPVYLVRVEHDEEIRNKSGEGWYLVDARLEQLFRSYAHELSFSDLNKAFSTMVGRSVFGYIAYDHPPKEAKP